MATVIRKTYQESGYKFGFVIDPKRANLIDDEETLDRINREIPRDASNVIIVDYDYVAGFTIGDIKSYKNLQHDNKIVFVMYDTIEYNVPIIVDGHYQKEKNQEQVIRYSYVIDLNKHYNREFIVNILKDEFEKILKEYWYKFEYNSRLIAFLEKYYYQTADNLIKHKRYSTPQEMNRM